MKVMIVSSLYGLNGGGAGIIAYNIAHGLAKTGHQISVVTIGGTRHYSLTEDQDVRIIRFQPINLYPFEEKDLHPPWQKFIWQLLDIYNFHCAGVYRKILVNEAPDIVHIHKMRGFSSAIWSVSLQMFPERVVQTCHDYESMSPDGLLRGAIGRMALHRQWPVRGYQLIRGRLSAGVSVVTAPSTFTLRRIIDSGLFPFAKSKVVVNTHGWSQDQLRSIHERTSSLSGNGVRFLFLGRLESEKGIVELCEAFSQAFDKHPSMILDIAGWGALDNYLRREYGNHPGINFLGTIDGKMKEDVLHQAAVVVVPSLVDEVFGLVTVEAFAFGKPVIATNVGGLPELVSHGETGWLIEAGNVQALVQHLELVAKINPVLLKKMSQNCKEYSYEFAVERVLNQYLDIYDQLIK
jgi:glycosyltransferase involved in cell wall biosynthesis